MKTLQELKNLYAKSQGYKDWWNYFTLKMLSYEPEDIELKMNELIELSQREALKNAYENAEMEETIIFREPYILKESIINENNILK